jgi:hypothetical protein
MHVHASVLDFLVTIAYMLLGLLGLRIVAARTSENSFGKALGAIVS